jgi:plasmid stabilization system protein ParE
MPGMGHRRNELASKELFVWPVGQYLIIYRPDTDPLEIVRVVSGYRDLAALLF